MGGELDLDFFRENITSSHGENGVLLAITRYLGLHDTCTFFEAGAKDGIEDSNCFPFVFKKWQGLFIEPNINSYKRLVNNYKNFPLIRCDNTYLSLEKGESINDVLGKWGVPKGFEICSIDIDGLDYWIWKDLKYRPKIVAIEYNLDFKGCCTVPYDPKLYRKLMGTEQSIGKFCGASAEALIRLGDHKGYYMVATTKDNLIFLRKDIYDDEKNKFKFFKKDMNNVKFEPNKREYKYGSDDMLIWDPPVD